MVLDLATDGAYNLGQELVKMGSMQNQHVLLSHTHWDHIQGTTIIHQILDASSDPLLTNCARESSFNCRLSFLRAVVHPRVKVEHSRSWRFQLDHQGQTLEPNVARVLPVEH